MIRSRYKVCKNVIFGQTTQTVPVSIPNQLIVQPFESFFRGVARNVTSGLIVVGATIGFGVLFKNRIAIPVNVLNGQLAVRVCNTVSTCKTGW